MGLLVGDGSLTYRDGAWLSNSEPSIQDEFCRIVREQFEYETKIKADGRTLTINSVQIRDFFAHLGMGYKRAHQKRIPPSILRAPRAVVVAFLQGLFDADGYADTKYGNVSLSTSSRRMAREVQLVLLNLGIISSIRTKKTKARDNYLVNLYGIDSIRFYERVGFRLERKHARRALASDLRMPNKGGIPYLEQTLRLVQSRIVSTPNKPQALKKNKRVNSIFYTYIPNKRNISYAKLAELIQYCHDNGAPCPELEAIQANGYFYDRVVTVERGGAEVYDLTVPDGRAYVAHGFVSHNSTALRQVAIITLMAQIGSFVPAERAQIGLVDRIFTRVGAQDDIATGRSTFMVEMTETANILHHATRRSLIVLDEIGRGTSTYDGLAIARAVVEYLHNHPRLGSRTIFATHYHELTEMARILPRLRNFNVAVSEEGGTVVFLRKIVPGGADRSYGIHVAQLAGLPRSVVHRADEVLAQLEGRGDKEERREAMGKVMVVQQLPLFGAPPNPVMDELKRIQVEELTPMEAINKLYELKRLAEEEEGEEA
jgi:DNA mismatch repair protein MutS